MHLVPAASALTLRWFEMPDLVGLIAPRAAFFEQGDKDPIFPVETFKQAVTKAQRIYKVFGVPQRMDSAIFRGEHEWNGKEGIPWLAKMLKCG